MNIFFHFLFNYVVVNLCFGNAWGYVAVIFVSSVLIDLTHLPYLAKVGSGVVKKRFGAESRTRFHELYGLILASSILGVLFFFVDTAIIQISALCIILHFAVDFLAGKSMPFYPVSKRVVFLDIFPYGYRSKFLFEVAATSITGVLFWLEIANLVL